MNEFIPINLVGYAMVLWFITGRQLGHIGAKYARQKRQSQLVFVALLIMSLSFTAYIAYYHTV